MQPDFTRIYGTWLYANLIDLTTNLSDLTLGEFKWPDITRIYATLHYTNLCNLTLREFMGLDFMRIDATRVNSCNVRSDKFV
jgi:hypothetical protein